MFSTQPAQVARESAISVTPTTALSDATHSGLEFLVNNHSAEDLIGLLYHNPQASALDQRKLNQLGSALEYSRFEIQALTGKILGLDPNHPDFHNAAAQVNQKLTNSTIERLANTLITDPTQRDKFTKDLSDNSTRPQALEELAKQLNSALKTPSLALEIGLILKEDHKLSTAVRDSFEKLCTEALSAIRHLRALAYKVIRAEILSALNPYDSNTEIMQSLVEPPQNAKPVEPEAKKELKIKNPADKALEGVGAIISNSGESLAKRELLARIEEKKLQIGDLRHAVVALQTDLGVSSDRSKAGEMRLNLLKTGIEIMRNEAKVSKLQDQFNSLQLAA